VQRLKRNLWLSQINLFGWLIICSFLASSVVTKNGGVSNYGNHYSTVVFYSIAFIADIVYLDLAAESLMMLGKQFKYLSRYFSLLCAITLVVFISTFPRRFGVIFTDIHDNISIALFDYELLLAIWLAFKRPKLDTFGYLLVMVSGSLVALLSAIHKIHLMFVGQMLGALGFALLLVLILPKVIETELAKRPTKR